MPDAEEAGVDALPPATSADVAPLPPVLDAACATRAAELRDRRRRRCRCGLGLYQGDKLDAGAELGYQRAARRGAAAARLRRARGAAAHRQQGQPRARVRGAQDLPDAAHARPLRRRVRCKAWVTLDWDAQPRRAAWRRSSAPRSKRTSTRCSRRARRGSPLPMDKRLVASVRDMLVALSARVPRLQPHQARSSVGADIPTFTVAGAGRPGGAAGVRARQRQAADQGRAGPVHQGRLPQGASSRRSTRRRSSSPPKRRWVLGLRPTEPRRRCK